MTILSGTARLAGITGWPVSHSRSPRLHGFWLPPPWHRRRVSAAASGTPTTSPEAIRGLHAVRICRHQRHHPAQGRRIRDLRRRSDETARRAGAVNTLVFENGRIKGSNTDGWGFLENLRAQGVDASAGPALILGAGGSARAVAAVLLERGVPVTVANRTRSRADELARELPGLTVIDWDARDRALPDHALLVNTTSLGMAGHPSSGNRPRPRRPRLAVADIVYVPLETPLLAAARARQIRCVEGLGMLLHQAIPGFRAWFGVEPTVDEALRRFVAADLLPE